MAKKKIKIKAPIYDSRCGDCYYNEEGLCQSNPATCPYNQPKKVEDESEDV